MSRENNKAEIAYKRASLSKDSPGIVTDTRWANQNSEGNIYRDPSSMNPEKALQIAIKNLKDAVHGNANAGISDSYESSAEVLKAIKEGKLKKIDAIFYAEKFKLISADKIDSITSVAAIQILENDANEDEVLNMVAQVVKPGDTYVNNGDQVKLMDQPNPKDSDVNKALPNPSNKTPCGEGESTVNTAKPDDSGNQKPDGTVSQDKLMAHPVPNDSTVNTAKPEEHRPEPTKLGSTKVNADSNSSTVNTAKPEDKKPAPTESPINVNIPNPKVSLDGSKESTVNTAKEEAYPAPKKAQMDMGLPPMDAAPAPAEKKDSPLDGLDKLDKPDGMPFDKKDKPKDPLKEVEEALDMLAKFKHILETVEERLEGTYEKPKEKKSKEDKGDKPEKSEKSDDGEKKEPKSEKSEDKKDDKGPAPEKKDEPKLPELPALAASKDYKIELINDKKSPVDSYYIVSYDNKPAFSVSGRQALAEEKKAEGVLTVAEFLSPEYSQELLKELKAQGALTVFRTAYASRPIVLAQKEDMIPNEKAPEPQAKDMAVTPPMDQALTNDPTQKESYADMILDIAADSLAMNKGASAQEFTEQMKSIFGDEAKTKEFQGRLSEKIDHKKVDMDATHSPDSPAMPSPEEVKAMKIALEGFRSLMPEVKAAIKERDELKAQAQKNLQDNILKARASKTLEVAQKKAECGLIDSEDVKTEALRLAKLSNEDLSIEIKNFENSIKIANKIKEKTDYNKVEDKPKTASVINVLASIPNQQTEEFETTKVKYPWSSGPKK